METSAKPSPELEAVVLAAGLSSRVPEFKPLLPWFGTSVLGAVVAGFRSRCARVLVVTGHRRAEIEAALAGWPGVELVHNPDYREGMFGSVQAGLARVRAGRFFICPGDQPLVGPALLDLLLAAWPAEGDGRPRALAPSWRGRGGHPVLAEAALLPLAAAEPRGSSLKALLGRVDRRFVAVDDQGAVADIDSVDDYRRLLGLAASEDNERSRHEQ